MAETSSTLRMRAECVDDSLRAGIPLAHTFAMATITTMTMWACAPFHCVLIIHEPIGYCGGELQLFNDKELVCKQSLTDLTDATLLALSWQRQHTPVMGHA